MKDLEVAYLQFNPAQALALTGFSQELANSGGPQACGVAQKANEYAEALRATLTPDQRTTLQRFTEGHLSALLFSQMHSPDDPLPEYLPCQSELEQDQCTLYLASRNQLLLALARYCAFAFDIDNDGKHVRLVANFKGGGTTQRPDEDRRRSVELSSHSGLRLGAHTEAPYNCSVIAHDGHSPAPSALILAARWNPAQEPTHIIPMAGIIERLGGLHALALTSCSFDFTRSECFVSGQGQAGNAVSILQFDANGGFSLRYNAYRFSLNDHASQAAERALDAFQALLMQAQPLPFVLQADKALLINNCRALHGRDTVMDNRRLLVRLFGYSPFARPLIIRDDPLLVRG